MGFYFNTKLKKISRILILLKIVKINQDQSKKDFFGNRRIKYSPGKFFTSVNSLLSSNLYLTRWKEKFFLLTQDYLHCFKKKSSAATEMGSFMFKVRFGL